MSAGQDCTADGRIRPMAVSSRRVVVLRGHSVNPWELRTWERLGPGYDVAVVVPPGNPYDAPVALERMPITTGGDPFSPLPGPPRPPAARGGGGRYPGPQGRPRGAGNVPPPGAGHPVSW